MITTENIPAGYTPYQSITICSNKIIGGGHIFAIGKILPLLIGVGPKPTIWLQAIDAPNSKNFVTIVDASIATHSAVRVSESGNKIKVVVAGKTVLAVEAISPKNALVTELDLRPLGLNVHGNSSMLFVGGMQISRSTFDGVGTAFGFGA